MRFQTLRSRSRGGAGEGLSPRPRLLLPGRLRLGEGSPGPVTCQHLLPLAAPGSHSLTPSLSPRCSHHLTAGGGHPGRRKPAAPQPEDIQALSQDLGHTGTVPRALFGQPG